MIIKEAHEKIELAFCYNITCNTCYNFIKNFNSRNLHFFQNLWVLGNMRLQIWIQLIEICKMYHISGGKNRKPKFCCSV
jgi:hypothetical protein